MLWYLIWYTISNIYLIWYTTGHTACAQYFAFSFVQYTLYPLQKAWMSRAAWSSLNSRNRGMGGLGLRIGREIDSKFSFYIFFLPSNEYFILQKLDWSLVTMKLMKVKVLVCVCVCAWQVASWRNTYCMLSQSLTKWMSWKFSGICPFLRGLWLRREKGAWNTHIHTHS